MRKQINIDYWEVKCDICSNKEITPTPQYSYKKCVMCDRDVCQHCNKPFYRFTNEYPEIYCSECWETGEQFRLLFDLEDKRHEEKIKEIYGRWKIRALERIKDKEKKNV